MSWQRKRGRGPLRAGPWQPGRPGPRVPKGGVASAFGRGWGSLGSRAHVYKAAALQWRAGFTFSLFWALLGEARSVA